MNVIKHRIPQSQSFKLLHQVSAKGNKFQLQNRTTGNKISLDVSESKDKMQTKDK